MTTLYPLLFRPNLRTMVWGGDRLAKWKSLPAQDYIGESWEVSTLDLLPSIVSNGMYEGMLLYDVIQHMPENFLGHRVVESYGSELPLLVKFIDTRDDLSVQVHPDDEMAHRLHQERGKTEMWYVIDAEPNACIYAGFRESITKEDFMRRIEDGSIMDALACHNVRRGDVFYIPAGRVHAIGKGVLLVEVQQASDLTYRIYDYGRLGLEGYPRELHTSLAAEVLDFQVYKEYKNPYLDLMDKANLCLDTQFFSVRVVSITHPIHRNMLKYDSFIIQTCTQGTCRVRIRATGDEILLKEGFSSFIPAAIADYDIIPLTPSVKLLEAYINNHNHPSTTSNTIRRIISQFIHMSGI